ncbi:MAG TPA: C45 family autoproteolytic acyltransferase/hydrolase [Candidatus Brocadiia bacterium]|nr:C45 family autoproteolytic acyltransferase/hydrolase [Candidatus Brocadiia bacterium]
MALRIIDLEGEPYEMGYVHGQTLEEEIHRLAEMRYRSCEQDEAAAGRKLSRPRALGLARECVHIQEQWAPDVHREFMGIARGARLSPEELLITNGYTDFRDLLSASAGGPARGCTSFMVGPRAAADGRTWLGQTWDMNAGVEPMVAAFRRKPRGAPRSVVLSTAGCLSLVGMNEHGLAIGNNNLEPTDARPGVVYLAIIHDFLRRTTLEKAMEAITAAPRASGHNYYMSDGKGRCVDIETTARHYEAIAPPDAIYTHANHYTAASLKPLEAAPPERSTLARERRLAGLLGQERGRIELNVLKRALGDRDGGEYGEDGHISRRGPYPTAAVAILRPRDLEAWFCRGPVDENELERVEFQ